MAVETLASTSVIVWAGRIASGLAVAFLLVDAAMKLVPLAPVSEAMRALGFAGTDALSRGLGVLLLACTLLYATPRTQLLGAILLTGYLGGAMAVQLRAGNPWLSHTLFGLYLGLMLWGGLLARSTEVRAALFR